MAPPPPPPPPFCLPFGSKKGRPLSPSRTFSEKSYSTGRSYPSRETYTSRRSRSLPRTGENDADAELRSFGSYSPTATITSRDNLTFKSDTESYNVPSPRALSPQPLPRKKGWGYGWGLGRSKDKDAKSKDMSEGGRGLLSRKNSAPATIPIMDDYIAPESTNISELSLVSPTHSGRPVRPLTPITDASPRSSATPSQIQPSSPLAQPPLVPPKRSDTRSSKDSKNTQNTQNTQSTQKTQSSRKTGSSGRSGATAVSASRFPPRRPELSATDSQSTLVGSALERKLNDIDEPKERVDTSEHLGELRTLMAKDNLDYYVVPSEDAHGSEYVAPSDKRREFISGFTGSAGQAIISKSSAYLVTDSRYWLQAEEELDNNWHLIRAPLVDSYSDWQSFLLSRVIEGTRIGIDARMISSAKASALNAALLRLRAKLIFPSQNLTDLVWKEKPQRSKHEITVQNLRFAGVDAQEKLESIRDWIVNHPPARTVLSKPGPPTNAQRHIATLVTGLSNIAWVLNLRGRDVPFNPVFHAYLFIPVNGASILFVDLEKLTDSVREYLAGINVEAREYNDIWSFLRRPNWGEGRVLIGDDASYAIQLLLTHYRYTIVTSPSFVETQKAIKNETEINGLRTAYLRDGASFVRWMAWLEDKLQKGYEVTEYEAAHRLTEYRRKNQYYEGLAYENISATGPNAALPHYSPTKSGALFIDRDTPYLNDSGAQYRDGTIDCTRTMHFGRPTPDQCEAYTRVLQGHIAIDSAIFPEGTSGRQLDVLARNALWKEGLNYLHGTGHGFGSYLNVHEGPHSFSSDVALEPGHVITNEPGFYNDGKWGMRIESALLVRKVRTKHAFQGDKWLGFERLAVVPIQTKMVRETMLSRDEIAWIKEHNKRCLRELEPYIREDKRALKWLRREAERGIGQASPGPGGLHIDWD